ncbi:hypothetical protein PAAG_05390 [Paracoccidioides lutzii Pb01]|uniref:Fungal-type protein kinase domain-containing protein n=1 Tax=Paracoccidioides lutzii (strain ATCC MYA-826 / Pb01) TaxID=502779 RepID=C1H3P7_PARBA|nr:hypothetical protein PAAG_05390 [Paracoccidioides lutzii Pb01]EEH34341.2 hypothetical protein PAAG_05390 [Paracoccidioides lutzii Pb01]
MDFSDIEPSEITFKRKLFSSEFSGIFLVHHHDNGLVKTATPERETNIHICESTAYRRLVKYGHCDCGIMFLNDKNPPSAIFLEYIPRMEMIHPHSFTKERGEVLNHGIREMSRAESKEGRVRRAVHRALVLHCDAKPRDVMIVSNDPERVIWLDFDRAQTYPTNSLTEGQQGFIEDEELMVSQLADSLRTSKHNLLVLSISAAHQALLFGYLSKIIFQETQISGQGDAGVQKMMFHINQPSRATQQENELAFSVQSAHEPSLFDRNGEELYDNCIFCCLVISPTGRPIYKYESLLELLMALHDAIKAHPSLYPDGNILHWDISKNNIIITDPEKADGHSGMLINLDLAKEFDSERSGAQHQTSKWSSWRLRCCLMSTIPIIMILSRSSTCLSGNVLITVGKA